MARDLPSGTVTFLFTDVEGSTKLLHALGTEAYADALGEHRAVVRAAFNAHGGAEVDTQGDAFFFAFPTAPGALAAAAQARDELENGPIHVRIGIHTGTPYLTDEGYVGPDVHRAARIGAAGHGGQILVSAATSAVTGTDGLRDLGEHRLKDLSAPERIYQLGSEDHPPLKTISNTNLPRPASSFIGRETEVQQLTEIVAAGERLVTLTGPGGTGKSRLAIEVASGVRAQFKDGVFWVGLASITESGVAVDAIGQTLGARGALSEHLGERQMLLVLDNVEQVVGIGPVLASLVEACPNLALLLTSRQRLRVRGEREYPVPPLDEQEGVALFAARAEAEPDDAVVELCRRLDQVPLAIELAAARASVLSPRQILDRLARRLDLLKGGPDAEPRQQTLRATVEWSHQLLSGDEQRLFARLAVFAGGCTVEAAEAVVDADIDLLQSLVDNSLVRRTGERFWMLETIREYALEQLEASGEADEIRARHANYYRTIAERADAELRAGEPEEGPVSMLEQEITNLRAAVAFGLAAGDADLVREITASLPMYWLVRGLFGEARAALDRALAISDAEDRTRRRLLSALGTIAYEQGDHATAVAASDEAAALSVRLHGENERFDTLRAQCFAALTSGDFDTAERLFRERLSLAISVNNGVATSSCRLNLAEIANKTGRHDGADALLAENLPFVRSRGQARCEAWTLAGLAETSVYRDRPADGAEDALLGARRALDIGDRPLAVHCLDLVAASLASEGELHAAALLIGAADAAREGMGVGMDDVEQAIRARAAALLTDDPAASERSIAEGRLLDLASAVEVAAAHVRTPAAV